MKKGVFIVLGAGVLILAFMNFSFPFGSKTLHFQQVSPLRTQFIIKVSATGVIEPENKINIAAPVPGRIDEVLVQDGDQVEKGQILAWMSSQERAALMDSISTQKISDMEKAELQDMYKPTPILAPAPGQVLIKGITPGQSVLPDAPLFELSDRLIFVSNVDETDIGKIVKDQKALVKIDAYPETTIVAKVKRIGHQSNSTTNITTYAVTLEANEPITQTLRAGMSISVDHILLDKSEVLVLPAWVTQGKQGTNANLRLKKGEEGSENRVVQLGLSNGEFVEVLSSLSENEIVLMPEQDSPQPAKKSFGLF